MEVSSSTDNNAISTNQENSQKVADIQEQRVQKAVQEQDKQAQKIAEDASEHSKEVTAQKTGIGNSINITG